MGSSELSVPKFVFFSIATCPPGGHKAKFEVIFAVNRRGGTMNIGLLELFWTTETSFIDSKHAKTVKIVFQRNQLLLHGNTYDVCSTITIRVINTLKLRTKSVTSTR